MVAKEKIILKHTVEILIMIRKSDEISIKLVMVE
jgi:hypothetical protein